MTLACPPSFMPSDHFSLSHPVLPHRAHYLADSYWSAPGPSQASKMLQRPHAHELSSALESVHLSNKKPLVFPKSSAGVALSASGRRQQRSPRSRSSNPYLDGRVVRPMVQQPQAPIETTFVAQNTGDMMCYLWFSTALKTKAATPSSLDDNSVPPDVKAELARLQFNPSAEFISFLGTLLSTTQVSQSVIILSLFYIYRLKLLNPHIRGMEGSEFRLAVIALMLANKFLDDNTYTNKTWSEVSGISLNEINLMEREFLAGVEHSLYIDYGAYQRWGSLLNGLLLAKERETQSWRRRFTDRHVIRYRARSPVPVHPQPSSATLQPTSCSSRHNQRARSTSPLPTNRYPTAAYPFTFAPPVSESHSNPFAPQVKIEHYDHPSYLLPPPTYTSPTKPSTTKRSAVDAFSPPPLVPFKLVKRESPSANGSPMEDSPMELTPVDGMSVGMMSAPTSPVEIVKPQEPMKPRTLQAPYEHDHAKHTSAIPQYLAFNTLASSPMDDAAGSDARGGMGARKTVLRYHDPRTLPPPETYPRQAFNYGPTSVASAHLTYPRRREEFVPMQTQSARTSPRDGIPRGPTSMMTSEQVYAHPRVLRPYHVPVAMSHQEKQPAMSLPPPLTCNNVPNGDRHPQIAPFANAGPPAVHHWTSVPVQMSTACTPIAANAHSSSTIGVGMGIRHQQQQQQTPNHWLRAGASGRTGIGSIDLGSPVLRGRRM